MVHYIVNRVEFKIQHGPLKTKQNPFEKNHKGHCLLHNICFLQPLFLVSWSERTAASFPFSIQPKPPQYFVVLVQVTSAHNIHHNMKERCCDLYTVFIVWIPSWLKKKMIKKTKNKASLTVPHRTIVQLDQLGVVHYWLQRTEATQLPFHSDENTVQLLVHGTQSRNPEFQQQLIYNVFPWKKK